MDLVLWIGGALIVGGVLGAILTAFVLGRGRNESGDMRDMRRELDDYRQEVAEHFIETAARVNALTNSYKALTGSYKSVYDHLEDGAYRLVGEDALRAQLEEVSSEPLRIDTMGPVRVDPEEARKKDGDSEEPPPNS